eukprot:gene22498-biopygen13277
MPSMYIRKKTEARQRSAGARERPDRKSPQGTEWSLLGPVNFGAGGPLQSSLRTLGDGWTPPPRRTQVLSAVQLNSWIFINGSKHTGESAPPRESSAAGVCQGVCGGILPKRQLSAVGTAGHIARGAHAGGGGGNAAP